VETPHSILHKYWHHAHFRPLQEDIIQAVLAGRDVLALLPTGGGKSVCFQVPALLRSGICIVVTPLVALMKDQVEQLRSRGIEAVAVNSAMSRTQIDILLDNCVYGNVKFLYVSPERLQNELFIARFQRMKVGLLAVDEAHCISQWGYEFRPQYLQIAAIREIHPDVPVVALTATATRQVALDIMEKLQFGSNGVRFQKSFARDNLAFVVRKTENKDRKVLEVLSKVNGSAIIYVRSRKATQEIAAWLVQRKISASYYHAGLTFEERSERQDAWIKNHTRVMVATNAFGMGIDKPDVRIVVHLDLPENMEAYYQEAGRGGRDSKRAFAVVIYHEADVQNLELKAEQSQPTTTYLKRVYQALSNYFQLAIGSGDGESFDFDLQHFSERFQLHGAEVFHALKRLESEGLIQFNESFYSPSMLHMIADRTQLYEFQIANARFDPIIKLLLRLNGGEILTGFSKISEEQIARALKASRSEVVDMLKHLHELQLIMYLPVKDKPQITFTLPRQDAEKLPLDYQRLEARRKLILLKMKAMANYVTSNRCRMQQIQEYFDEETDKTCGICDICVRNRKETNSHAFEIMRDEVLRVLKAGALTVEQIEGYIAPKDHELFVDVVRDMVDDGMLQYDSVWRLGIGRQKR
jgi:ATP-dependent DNA helicase RecQ